MIALPHFFLADLPDRTAITPRLVQDACLAIRSNRRSYLLARTTASIIETLVTAAENWRSHDYPLRRLALESCPVETGFSRPMLERGLDAFFARFTRSNFLRLIEQDLGATSRLDGWVAPGPESASERAALARGFNLVAHVAGGRLPTPTFVQIALGLLTRAAVFTKCPSGTSLLPRLFAHSIHEIDPKLGACIELADWPGGSTLLEQALFENADCVVATGSDSTLPTIRDRLPVATRFVPHGHRVSFAFFTREILAGFQAAKFIARAAWDIAAWDQLGCLSPHVLYLEDGGPMTADTFCEHLAQELTRLESSHPRAPLDDPTAAAIATRRSLYQVRAAHSAETRLWTSPHGTAWTIVRETDPLFQASCGHRFVYVKPVAHARQAMQSADAVRFHTSTVGLAATDDRAADLAREFALWGATRICPVGRMQEPPLAWRHDGRPALADLVTWTDWEQLYDTAP